MNNVSAYKCALLIYIRSYSTIVDIFTFFFLITSNLKAAKVLWERANRNQYEFVYVYALHIFTSTNIFDKQHESVYVRVCLMQFTIFSTLCTHFSLITMSCRCVQIFFFFCCSGHSNWLCVFSVNVVRQTNCYFFSFSFCSLSHASHRHTQWGREKERSVRLTVD